MRISRWRADYEPGDRCAGHAPILDRISAHASEPALRATTACSGVSDLEWEERDAADAYLLTWDTACRMASVLATEVGVASEDTQRLVTAVRELGAASSPGNVVGAMRAACRAAASRTVGQSRSNRM